jgi:hypothetical protein
LLEGSAVLPLFVDAAFSRGQITFPVAVQSIHIDRPVSPTYGTLCLQNLRGCQNVDVIGPVTGPTKTDRMMAPVEVCIGQQFCDCKPAYTAAVFHAG